jgi:hypothetical protein
MTDQTGAICLLLKIFVTLASTRFICCVVSKKGEFVRIILLFSVFVNKSFLHITVLYHNKIRGH